MSEELRSSLNQFLEFKSSAIWLDILGELWEWVQQIREIQDTEESLVELYRSQGRIEAINYFQNLPDAIIEALEVRRGEQSGTE